MITVGIIDDHPLLRSGVEHTLEASADVRVICSVGSVAQFVESGARPDVVVLDLYLDGQDQPSSLPAVHTLTDEHKVLVMSASGRRRDVLGAIAAGAAGYITKQASPAAFLAALTAVASGGFYLSSQLADMLQAELRQRSSTSTKPTLTPRGDEALRYIARGFTHAQTARRMGVSEDTVDTYVKRIKDKLGLGNKADLTRKAIELGHLDPRAGSDEPPPGLS